MIFKSMFKKIREKRNNKRFAEILNTIYEEAQSLLFRGDSEAAKENANADATLVSTKRSLTSNALERELYKNFFLTKEELAAVDDGYIHVHDMPSRRHTINCCLFDAGNVMRGGFTMGNIWYNEPKTADSAFDVMGDLILSAAGQQYGGFTVPNIDEILAPYVEKSYLRYLCDKKTAGIAGLSAVGIDYDELSFEKKNELEDMWERDTMAVVKKEIEAGFQGLEYKLNSVASSRGDYPFVTFTFGNLTGKYEQLISSILMSVRKGGQGAPGKKRPVLFPKLVFLYDENLHGAGGELEYLFLEAVECTSKTMYPDYLSLTGEGYVSEIYKKYGLAISPMGCRAFLSPWWEKGGFYKADESDVPVFVGRFNIGVVSLNLPMIYAKAKKEGRSFYEILDYYLELIRGLHLRTYDYLGEFRASVNPLAYCEGGFFGGYLKRHEKIKPLLDSATASFGITALNELQMLYNKKPLHVDSDFAYEVMEYINTKVAEFKEKDHRLYAIYATPAESLCGKQVKQFRKLYGIVAGVSDRSYVSNSFHCHVTAELTPSQKQDKEGRFWNLFNGGKIQFVRYPIDYNIQAMITYIRRAMKKGFYAGVNLRLSYCNDCGYEALSMDECPHCKSKAITKIDRMNGYLGYSSLGVIDENGKPASSFNKSKDDEIRERVSF